MYKDKRGLSAVVTTLLLIMLSVAAVAIIAGFVVPWVQSSLNEGTACLDYSTYFEFDNQFDFNCYALYGSTPEEGYEYALTIKADNVDQEIADKVIGFKLVFLSSDSSESIEVFDGDASSPGNVPGGIRSTSPNNGKIEIPGRGEVRTFVYLSKSDTPFKSVSILPILKDREKTCDPTDEVRLEGESCFKEIP